MYLFGIRFSGPLAFLCGPAGRCFRIIGEREEALTGGIAGGSQSARASGATAEASFARLGGLPGLAPITDEPEPRIFFVNSAKSVSCDVCVVRDSYRARRISKKPMVIQENAEAPVRMTVP